MYFGDGAMGISTSCRTAERTNETFFSELFAVYQEENSSHFWIMDISIGIYIFCK